MFRSWGIGQKELRQKDHRFNAGMEVQFNEMMSQRLLKGLGYNSVVYACLPSMYETLGSIFNIGWPRVWSIVVYGKKMHVGLGRVGTCVTTDLRKPEDNSAALALPFHLCAGSEIKPKSGLTRNRKRHLASPTYRGWEGCEFSSCWVVFQPLGQFYWLQALLSSGFPSS